MSHKKSKFAFAVLAILSMLAILAGVLAPIFLTR